MPKRKPGESTEAFVERMNASALCSECGSSVVSANGRLTCPSCGMIDLAPEAAADTSQLCLTCPHPMDASHDAFGCAHAACPCTNARVTEPLPNASESEVSKDFAAVTALEKTNADPRAAFDAHAQNCANCMAAYNSGKTETLCENGMALMNKNGGGDPLLEKNRSEHKAERENSNSLSALVDIDSAPRAFINGEVVEAFRGRP